MYYHHRGHLTSRLLTSKYNAHGVRVYIPLKGQKDGRAWIKPIVINTFAPAIRYPLLMSFDKTVFIPFTFWTAQYIITTPFSLEQLKLYARRAAATNEVLNEIVSDISPVYLAQADPAILALYNANKSNDDADYNARLAFALGMGKRVTPTKIIKPGIRPPRHL
jgi:hypothetical protein